MRSRIRQAVIALPAALALAIAWLAPGPALAMCALPPDGQPLWQNAESVFVGTVTDVANRQRWATVSVEEVWIGPDVAAEVVVQGGPADPNAFMEDERIYEPGLRYLFAVTPNGDGTYQDSGCSGTTDERSIDLASIRPADVRAPMAATDKPLDLSGLTGPAILVGIVVVLLAVTVFFSRRQEA